MCAVPHLSLPVVPLSKPTSKRSKHLHLHGHNKQMHAHTKHKQTHARARIQTTCKIVHNVTSGV